MITRIKNQTIQNPIEMWRGKYAEVAKEVKELEIEVARDYIPGLHQLHLDRTIKLWDSIKDSKKVLSNYSTELSIKYQESLEELQFRIAGIPYLLDAAKAGATI